ncbi:MAG: hypothetical protein P8130_13450 [Deltaproteobacteria bacterium]
MRPSFVLGLIVVLFLGCDAAMYSVASQKREAQLRVLPELHRLVAYAGITDLCLSTEARYIRNLAVSDPMAPFMDHPGAIEHFPSGSFYYPPLPTFPAKGVHGGGL